MTPRQRWDERSVSSATQQAFQHVISDGTYSLDDVGPHLYKNPETADAFYLRQSCEFVVGCQSTASYARVDDLKSRFANFVHVSHLCEQQLYVYVIWYAQPHKLPYYLVVRTDVYYPSVHSHLPLFVRLSPVAAR